MVTRSRHRCSPSVVLGFRPGPGGKARKRAGSSAPGGRLMPSAKLWLVSAIVLVACQPKTEPPKPARRDAVRRTVALVTVAPAQDPSLAVPASVPTELREHLRSRLASLPDIQVVRDQEVKNARNDEPVCRSGVDLKSCWPKLARRTGANRLVRVNLERLEPHRCRLTLVWSPDVNGKESLASSETRCVLSDLFTTTDEMLRSQPETDGVAITAVSAPACETVCERDQEVCQPDRRVCRDANWDGCSQWLSEPCPEGHGCSNGTCIPGNPAMVFVPEGRFEMGSNPKQIEYALRLCLQRDQDCRPSWWRTEQPAHWVHIPGFWIDRTEVTQSAYAACVEAGACSPLAEHACLIWDPASQRWISGPRIPKKLNGDNMPAVCISWDEAQKYCLWRSMRLPSEAEWEKTARGKDGRLYPWGNSPFEGSRANGCDLSCGTIAKKGWRFEANVDDGSRFLADVGSYPAGVSPYGALDMSGNVWEWVADWYGENYYGVSERRAPQGPNSGEYRVVRGGSWANEADSLRSAYRYQLSQTTRMTTVGFRCACP